MIASLRMVQIMICGRPERRHSMTNKHEKHH
jgi:hypothetical protein